MATEYGNPKFRDSNKNLPFTMNGQPAIDAYKELSAHNISDKEALLGVLTKMGLKAQNLELRYQSIFQALSLS